VTYAKSGLFWSQSQYTVVSMFPSFRRYKEGTGGRGKIEPGPPVGSLASSRGFTGPLY
jgi:hypothetical protein